MERLYCERRASLFRRTGASIGLVSAGRPEGSFEETLVAPLLHLAICPRTGFPEYFTI